MFRSLGGSSSFCANYNISIDKVGKSKHKKNFTKFLFIPTYALVFKLH